MNSKRPNVVVCLCDQLRAFEVGCYGNTVVKTPNIDRLARDGVRFEVACSNNPVCTPARSILLSGQYGRTCTGLMGNAEDPVAERRIFKDKVMPEVFKAAGYDTALIGKWHIDPDPTLVGFDYALYPQHRHRYTNQPYKDSKGRSYMPDGYSADFEMEHLGNYINEHKDRPFFLYYNISQPHMPLFDSPEKYQRMYSRDSVKLRKNVYENGKAAYDEKWFKIYLWDYLYYLEHLPYTEKLPENFDLRDLTSLYDGMTTWVDDQVGNMMNLLEAHGIADNTLVVFTSDHGDNLGSHQLFNKDSLFEESIRIPLIFRWPWKLDCQTVDTQVASLVDIMPSILSLCNLETPKTVQGTDLSQVIKGESETAGENAAFIETVGWDAGIRTLTHLYGVKLGQRQPGQPCRVEDDKLMFYNIKADPLQERNLAKTDEELDICNDLKQKTLRWNRETQWQDRSEG